ncbi:hypothetical protein BpHYR1_006063 [Brachionus plicatilis]|uniref:Uncharacterized protein n=1 Tax=Brachionus plicatilis TaxID=10195 RepID=A0A3M7RDP5_BRAPC|nr:hypothetical protein BpHYR1_006063 [Brachionus plicatilis]
MEKSKIDFDRKNKKVDYIDDFVLCDHPKLKKGLSQAITRKFYGPFLVVGKNDNNVDCLIRFASKPKSKIKQQESDCCYSLNIRKRRALRPRTDDVYRKRSDPANKKKEKLFFAQQTNQLYTVMTVLQQNEVTSIPVTVPQQSVMVESIKSIEQKSDRDDIQELGARPSKSFSRRKTKT